MSECLYDWSILKKPKEETILKMSFHRNVVSLSSLNDSTFSPEDLTSRLSS